MASGFPSAHQRKLGPAPIASFEDLSDEVENGGAEQVTRMPGIVEVTTPVTPASSLKTPSTPRIDISRASSSSQHEDSNSRESTPEKELLAGIAPPEGCKLQLGYKEDAQDLRSSTEELDLQDPIHEQDLKREAKRARKRAKELHDGTQSEYGVSIKLHGERERKDSNCSEIILLNISGRTSRLSSVGSQGSGVSGGALSVVSATSSRKNHPKTSKVKFKSPSPHKCLLETSFCGSVSTLANTLIEPSKPENDDLAKILLQREEDSTRAMIPESVRVPIVGGNLKPDPLDLPIRRRGREERKEIFRREVEITKRVLKKVNIEVPIIKLPKDPDDESSKSSSEVQKPASLDLQNDRRKRSPSTASTSSRAAAAEKSVLDTPKLQRHQKIRDLEGSRTPSPSSVSRKSSFASIFKGRADAASIQSQDSPTTSSRRTSLASRLKDTAESLRSRSKSRERPSSGEKSPGGSSTRRPDSRNRASGGGGVFSSTLSLFKKRERKKSGSSIGTPDTLDGSHGNLDSIGCVEFTFNQQHTPSRPSRRKEDVIFISLYGDNDEFRNKPEKEDEPEETALPSESVAIPLESPTKHLDDYDASSPQQTSANIVCTDVTIEHHRKSRRSERRSRDGARISSSSGDSTRLPESHSRDSHISKSESRDSKIATDDRRDITSVSQQPISENREDARLQRMSTSSSRDSITKKPEMVKPKRKSKTIQRPTEAPPGLPPKVEVNGKVAKPIVPEPEPPVQRDELMLPQAPITKTPSVVSDLDHNSSESERDSEIDFIRNKAEKGIEELPDERKGLCYEESFEEDLPYVPTTLPMEKSVAVPILPVKQRLQEVKKTTPIERPRSTTPINPTLLDEFIMHTSTHDDHHGQHRRSVDKMKISLPREDSFKLKSPHRPTTGHTFSEFAGRVGVSRGFSLTKSPSPPPLPPRAPTTVLTTKTTQSTQQQQQQQQHQQQQHQQQQQQQRPANWINFEEIPEKRKAPKRIQTIPRLEDEAKLAQPGAGNVGQYSYVQPEECRCECHEESRRASLQQSSSSCQPGGQSSGANGVCNGENCATNGGGQSANADRASIVSDNSSLDCSLSADYTPGHQRSGSNGGARPFAMDLDVSSNRSSIISQEETEDEH